jgi:hypothetical protein
MENRSISLALISCRLVSIFGLAATKLWMSPDRFLSLGSGVSFNSFAAPSQAPRMVFLLLQDHFIPNPLDGRLAVDLGLDLFDHFQLSEPSPWISLRLVSFVPAFLWRMTWLSGFFTMPRLALGRHLHQRPGHASPRRNHHAIV